MELAGPMDRAYLVMGSSLGSSMHAVMAAFKLSSVSTEPRSHPEAMADDPLWLPAEETEIENHRSNESWIEMDRSSLPRGRKLIKLVWAYKRKRNGKLKARLCVQGCAQRPGVDYDQSHCSTMRASSLRVLSAAAAQLGLSMRRWDFVAAYLQGELLDDEVVYCYAPPGHGVKGRDGRERIVKVMKPIYGMVQAGRRWQRSIYPWIKSQGFEQTDSDKSVFVRRETVQTPSGPSSR